MAATTAGSLFGPAFFAYSALCFSSKDQCQHSVLPQHFPLQRKERKPYDAALRDHGLQPLGRQRLLKEGDEVELDRVEEDVAGHEQLVRLAEAEQLKRSHELLVLLGALAHRESRGPFWDGLSFWG